MAAFNTEPPGEGDKTTLEVNGTTYGVRVIQKDKRITIFYYSEIEEEYTTSADVENKLDESLAKTGNDGTGKSVFYDAI